MAGKGNAEHDGACAPPYRGAAALLESGLDLLPDGFAIFNRELSLVARNAPFGTLCGYPDDLCEPGVTLETLLRHDALHGAFGRGDCEKRIATSAIPSSFL